MFILPGKNGKSLWKSCKFLGHSTSTSKIYPLSLSSSKSFVNSSLNSEIF